MNTYQYEGVAISKGVQITIPEGIKINYSYDVQMDMIIAVINDGKDVLQIRLPEDRFKELFRTFT